MGYRPILLVMLLVGSMNFCQSQPNVQQKQNPADPVLVDKIKLSKELIALRDSINHELEFIGQRMDTSTSKRPSIERARKKLRIEKGKVEEVIENVVNATKDTWDYYIHERAANSVIQINYEYRRIKKELLEATSANH
jgi:hypothetical protein